MSENKNKMVFDLLPSSDLKKTYKIIFRLCENSLADAVIDLSVDAGLLREPSAKIEFVEVKGSCNINLGPLVELLDQVDTVSCSGLGTDANDSYIKLEGNLKDDQTKSIPFYNEAVKQNGMPVRHGIMLRDGPKICIKVITSLGDKRAIGAISYSVGMVHDKRFALYFVLTTRAEFENIDREVYVHMWDVAKNVNARIQALKFFNNDKLTENELVEMEGRLPTSCTEPANLSLVKYEGKSDILKRILKATSTEFRFSYIGDEPKVQLWVQNKLLNEALRNGIYFDEDDTIEFKLSLGEEEKIFSPTSILLFNSNGSINRLTATIEKSKIGGIIKSYTF